MINSNIFREYDIRGVVGKDFDGQFAFLLGQAYVTYLRKNGNNGPLTVSVGHDARLSSPELAKKMIEGITTAGADVVFLGLVTTPISYFSTFALPISGGIMITGSHNPPEYNGFKISVGKSTIFGEEIQKIGKIILNNEFLKSDKKGSSKDIDIFTPYLKRFGTDFNIPRPIKIIFDCGNGAAGVIARKLFSLSKFDFEILFEEPDGRFPNHHPDPTVEENLIALRDRVLATKAVAGIGFDGDADRIGVVDHTGRALFGDELMVIFSRAVLKDHPGSVVIGDVKCSDRLYNDIAKCNGKPIMYKTGHSLIKNKMKEVGSKFSGEMSGHVFFADRNYGYDDAVYAGMRLVEILSTTGKTIPELLEGIPSAFSTPEIRIDTTDEKKTDVVNQIKAQFSNGKYKTNDTDGIRISFDDGFALVRASNTQPVLVCRFEATTEKRLKEIRQLVEGAVQKLL